MSPSIPIAHEILSTRLGWNCVSADRCIDRYVELKNDSREAGKSEHVDERLSAIVERLFER
jgi:hypothetical protein